MDKYLQIVNSDNKFNPSDYTDFEYVDDITVNYPDAGEKAFIEKETYDAYLALKKFLGKKRIPCSLNSAGRTVNAQRLTQQEMYGIYLKEYEQNNPHDQAVTLAKQKVLDMVAVPGYSEHHTGLAIDVSPRKYGKNPLTKYLAKQYNKKHLNAYFEFINKVAPQFGFIVRYTRENAESTGVKRPEPWHLRYVGKECAMEIATIMETDPSYSLEKYVAERIGGSTRV